MGKPEDHIKEATSHGSVCSFKQKGPAYINYERYPENGSSHSKTFWDIMHPFFSGKCDIQLPEGTLLTMPTELANVINECFTNITVITVIKAILDVDDEFISLRYEKYKDHLSGKRTITL